MALARVLRAENALLAAGDMEAAVRLLPTKRRAAEAFTAAMQVGQPDAAPGGERNPEAVTALQAVVEENNRRLALAMQVQGRVLAMVARAARDSAPRALQYGAGGGAKAEGRAMAVVVRA